MDFELMVLIGITAAFYASVGHGGASGYLGLMALTGFSPQFMRPSALMLNLLVAGIAFIQYYRNDHFNFHRSWPYMIGSVPAAFIGGTMELSTPIYKAILGVFLLIAVLRMTIPLKTLQARNIPFKIIVAVIIGVLIGLLSGMIGIGGGIVLSPVILLLGWGDAKSSAATSAIFIWINSLAGLSGFLLNDGMIDMSIYPAFLFAGFGAIVGGFLGSFKWKQQIVKYVLSAVLLFAAFKLIFFI